MLWGVRFSETKSGTYFSLFVILPSLNNTNGQIPGFGLYKLFNLVRPFLGMFLPSLFGPKRPQEAGAGAGAAAGPGQGEEKESRKQAKLRARMEKGDKRVQQVQRK